MTNPLAPAHSRRPSGVGAPWRCRILAPQRLWLSLGRQIIHAISTRLYVLSLLTTINFMAIGCGNEGFKLRVENVFYIRTIDRVIVTGSVSSGTVMAGDHLVVRSGSMVLPVTVERLEHPKLTLESASKGQQVGLVLIGINKDQVRDGDSVETP